MSLRSGLAYPTGSLLSAACASRVLMLGVYVPYASMLRLPPSSLRTATSNRWNTSSHSLSTVTVPAGIPAICVESQTMLTSRPLSSRGEMSCALPVAAPLMPRSEPRRGLTMDMSNLFRLRLRVSLCVFEALPYALTDCSPLISSTDDMSMLPSLTESLDGCILHSLELRCRVDGSMSMPSASPSASRERSPRTMNSPRFSSSPLLSYE